MEKQVVIDLGGIHDALTDTVDLWKYIDRTDKNKEHHLTILYMERGAGKANCNMKFTLPECGRDQSGGRRRAGYPAGGAG